MRILNKRTHSITLSAATPDSGIVSYTIDGQREDPTDREKLVDGVRDDIPDEFIDLAIKQSKVVQTYFEEKYLVIEGGGHARKAK